MIRADGELVAVSYHVASVDQKMGGRVGNAFSFGTSKVESKTLLRIDKEKASVRFRDRQPQLLDVTASVGSSPDNINLIRLIAKDKYRYVEVGSSGANAAGSSSSSMLFPDGIRIEMTAETVSGACMQRGRLVSQFRLKPAQA